MSSIRIGIIGEGIIGLSVANIIREQHPEYEIEITSSSQGKDTTSYGAAGFCLIANYYKTIDINRLKKWNERGLEHYLEVYRSADCVKAGITVSMLYLISKEPMDYNESLYNFYPSFRVTSEKELNNLGFDKSYKYGINVVSTIVEGRYYLDYLRDNFLSTPGSSIRQETLNPGSSNVADWALSRNYDVVVNCAGLGSRFLFNDDSIRPLRGQVARVHAPWLKYSFMTKDDTYAFCCRDSVVIGGFRQANDWCTAVRAHELDDIRQRIALHNTCLSQSHIIEEWVGLRPYRDTLRLEVDNIHSNSGRRVAVVHNYGHGSSGIGLSWGTSLEAAELVDGILNNQHARL